MTLHSAENKIKSNLYKPYSLYLFKAREKRMCVCVCFKTIRKTIMILENGENK